MSVCMQEDAAKPKLTVPLPAGALAWKFGGPGSKAPGFTHDRAQMTVFPGMRTAGFVDPKKLKARRGGLAGRPERHLCAAAGGTASMAFRARVPARRVFRLALRRPRHPPRNSRIAITSFVPAANVSSTTCRPRTSTTAAIPLPLPRHAAIPEKPHALWMNYIDRMYPVHTTHVKVADGVFTLEAENFFVSAVVLVPASAKDDFDKFADTARRLRIEAFEKTLRPLPGKKPQAQPGDGPLPRLRAGRRDGGRPWTGPTAEERERHELAARGRRAGQAGDAAAGGRPLRGPRQSGAGGFRGRRGLDGSAPAGDRTTVYFQGYRYDGDTLSRDGVDARRTLDMRAGRHAVLLADAGHSAKDQKPGNYGCRDVPPEKGEAVQLDLDLEVYPFTLEPVLPVSFGMYYHPRREPGLAPEVQRRLVKEQFQWMRQIGFTAVQVGPATVTGLGKSGTVQLQFDTTLYDLAREAGMGRHPSST